MEIFRGGGDGDGSVPRSPGSDADDFNSNKAFRLVDSNIINLGSVAVAASMGDTCTSGGFLFLGPSPDVGEGSSSAAAATLDDD